MIIFGLGNPGKEYEKTRHNVGFTFLDKLQQNWNLSDFKFNKKFNAEIAEKKSSNFLTEIFSQKKKLMLVKPQTFMNRSGETVQKIISFYKLSSRDIIVVHDDLDFTIGNYKISVNSSAGGHNGIQNIIEKIGTQKFTRIRIGIEKQTGHQFRKIPGQKFVLQNFTPEEQKILAKTFNQIQKELSDFTN